MNFAKFSGSHFDFWVFRSNAKKVLREPRNFFGKLESKGKIEPAFGYFVDLLIVSSILSIVGVLLFQPIIIKFLSENFNIPTQNPSYTLQAFLIAFVESVVGGALLSFLWSGILHLWIRLFKGNGDFAKSYELYVYTRTPILLTGWIPLVGLVGWFYSIYLMMIGVQKLHGISKKRSILMFGVPFVIVVLFWIVGIVSLFVFKGA